MFGSCCCFFIIILFMQYEKKLVSLYDNLSFSKLPVCFITLDKNPESCRLTLSLFKDSDGWLFVFVKNKCFVRKILMSKEFVFERNVFDGNDCFFVVRSEKCSLFGKIGEVQNIEAKVVKVEKKFHELKMRESVKSSTDKNQIVDWVIEKMFSFQEKTFFWQTKNQLEVAFMTHHRSEFLEKKIQSSKFVEMGDENDKFFAGVVYRKNQPYAISVGHKEKISEFEKTCGEFQCFCLEDKPEYAVFLVFRRASDADVCFV